MSRHNLLSPQDKLKTDDDITVAIHQICFQAQGTKNDRKKNVRKFSGYVAGDEKTKDAIKTKLLENKKRYTVPLLKDCANVVGLEKTGSREEIIVRLIEYFAAPKNNFHLFLSLLIKGLSLQKKTIFFVLVFNSKINFLPINSPDLT